MNRFPREVVVATLVAWAMPAGALFAQTPPLSFNRDVRPILSENCFACHGPDKGNRKAELRLDLREAATAPAESGDVAIVPGDVQKSVLLERIFESDESIVMPPPKSHKKLTATQKETLKRWIAEGAKYERHWAFLPLQPVAATQPGDESPIDAAVSAALAKRGLPLQVEPDRGTLLRRVSFDITGLPPTPEEVIAFEKDHDPGAYERVVDRLLKSPRFGERMAVDWLDIARYADSYGFQVDRPREMWPWRDWVIRAFNDNLPFDKFITWQLAGDLLPMATEEQILATAFNRLHQQESEGGSVEEEYRVEYVADRVQTVATAFLGLTFECSRCHDHKFDPITQRDYYGLFAMLGNIDEAGLYSYFTQSMPTPAMPLLDTSAKEKLTSLRRAVADEEQKTAALRAGKEPAFAEWLKSRPGEVALPGEIGRFDFDNLENNKLANALNKESHATLKGDNRLVPGVHGQAVEFTGDDAVDLPFGNFGSNQPFSVSLWLKTPDVKERAVVFHRSRAWTDAASRGYELLIEDGKLKWSLIHFWPGDAISIRGREPLAINTWTHVVVTNDGSGRAAGLRLFVNGEPLATEIERDSLTREITGGGGDTIALAERFRDRGFKNGSIDEFRVFTRELSALEVLAIVQPDSARELLARDAKALSDAERATLFEYFLAAADAEFARQLATLSAARGEALKFASGQKEIMVMRELLEPKPAYVLFRGEYNQRREAVPMGVPEWLLPLPAGAPQNRLGLAQWLTDPRHPLTARVTVNRIWQSIWGRGLVNSTEDFGSQGGRPLYPEVLDALAARFIASGWDVKALVKTIVMSRTYRQRSIADAPTMADDPDNEWLARGPRIRLSAEMVRDNALAAAGLLTEQLGGPPVNPYELSEGFKPEKPSDGDGVYRRSLYTNWRRTSAPPAMVAFDAPRRAVCISRRERTDSPLQAFILLNGVQYVEAARVLGEKLHKDANGDVRAMIEHGFLRCLSRQPDAKEIAIATRLYNEQLAWFRQSPAEAEKLLTSGNAKRDASIPAVEAAAAAVLAQALLNHDACVVKR